MTWRLLDPSEWERLAGLGLPLPPMVQERSRIVVVEDGGELVAVAALQSLVFADCLWVHPAHRGHVTAIRQLWAGLQHTVRSVFASSRWLVGVELPSVRRFLRHRGAIHLPIDLYAVTAQE